LRTKGHGVKLRNNTHCNQQPTHAAKKYQVRREARVEFRIVYNYGFLQEPHSVTSQKTPFCIVTAMKTSILLDCLIRHPCFFP
jgi:hypothetical protein